MKYIIMGNEESTVKNAMKASTKAVLAIAAIILVILVIWGLSSTLNSQWFQNTFASTGEEQTQAEINPFLKNTFGVLLGFSKTVPLSYENLILYLAIFFILFFAMSEIIQLFSTFSPGVSYMIGAGLALIAGVTKVIHYIASVFAITAGIGAMGIALIILAAIFSAVILNLGIGGPLRKWRMKRQQDIKRFRAQSGFDQVATFIKGAKSGANAAAEGE